MGGRGLKSGRSNMGRGLYHWAWPSLRLSWRKPVVSLWGLWRRAVTPSGRGLTREWNHMGGSLTTGRGPSRGGLGRGQHSVGLWRRGAVTQGGRGQTRERSLGGPISGRGLKWAYPNKVNGHVALELRNRCEARPWRRALEKGRGLTSGRGLEGVARA